MLCCEILWSLNRCFSCCHLLNLRRIAGDIPLLIGREWGVWGARVWEQCGGWRRVLVSEPPSNKTEAWSELLSYDGSGSRQNIPASAAARSVQCPVSTLSTVSTTRRRWGWWCEEVMGTRGHKEAACVLQLGPRPGDNSAQCAVPSWPGPGPGLLTTQCYRWLIDSQNSQNSAPRGSIFSEEYFLFRLQWGRSSGCNTQTQANANIY